MIHYRTAEQNFHFVTPIPELGPYETKNVETGESIHFVPDSDQNAELISHTISWIGGEQRALDVYNMARGMLLRVEKSGEFFIGPLGESIGKSNPKEELSKLDREIILGPALVLALALRSVWSLHASAAMYKENVIVLLGESGQGKSTLAAYLSQGAGWRLVADDILPVKIDTNGISVLPRFPQLKLPLDAQPGVDLPEQLPLKTICVLAQAEPSQMPELHKLSTVQTVQSLLSHIAGTRMFNAALLARHLDFSAHVGKQIPAYKLIYPHRRDTLPLVREFFEKIC